MTTLATNNEAWGFWGTIAHHGDPAPAPPHYPIRRGGPVALVNSTVLPC
jgi:hypothetical protein